MGFQLYTMCLLTVYLTQSNGDSSEDHHPFVYNHPYAPTSLRFHDIYPTHNAILPEEHINTASDEDVHLNTVPSEFVEFHPQTLKIHPVTPTPVTNSTLETVVKETPGVSLISTTTHEPEEIQIKVAPIKQVERGVLDLLLPPPRVRAFKSVFDTFRRMLSYTFKKR